MSSAAVCTIRSRTVGIPSGRSRPSGFGMYTVVQGVKPELRLLLGLLAQLRSTGISRFIATMNPSDSHTSRPAVMRSRRPLAPRRARDAGHWCGSLRFLIDLSASAVPNHPGEFAPLRVLIASRRMTGFTTSGGLATLN